ncbi:MAG TPA: ATP-dependent sacrificial sulfur transferase LarE [Geobacteraceae bacterium]|nr:ATP-dependent sacrificial sulfur transferase LarE [Geobacteraceae bacterium]
MDSLQEKYEKLREIIENMESVLIAFSGGVDSTFLLKVAHDVLGDRACAVTAVSPTYPDSEFREAVDLARRIGARHLVVESNELDIPGFAENPEDRCYHCKRELFGKLAEKARELGISWLAEGSNMDDLGDYRPGRRAVAELSVRSPLLEAGLSKEEIRRLSRDTGLPTWDKQPYACLSSRFPFGVRITGERLHMIETCEDFLKGKGFRTYRVRFHDETARIEVGEEEISMFLEPDLRREVSEFFRSAGFIHVALDLQGYRTGSMNYIGQRAKG